MRGRMKPDVILLPRQEREAVGADVIRRQPIPRSDRFFKPGGFRCGS